MKKRTGAQTAMFRSSAELAKLYRAESRVKKAGLGRVVASRILTEANVRDSKVIVTIGAPRRVEADHWLCPFHIEGIVESGVHYSPGVDSLQSLVLAVALARGYLEKTGRNFIWFGDDHGIPQQVPTDYGRDFAQRVEKAIERESKNVQLGRLRARKAEIASAEARLKVFKKAAAKYEEPAEKANFATEITKEEVRLKSAKKNAADWEANLKKWKP